jgi:hypothetical protein
MKQTAVEWLYERFLSAGYAVNSEWKKQAKEMEKEQMGYTKEDVLRAGEMGEICYLDTEHIVSYLDEAKHYNETFNTKREMKQTAVEWLQEQYYESEGKLTRQDFEQAKKMEEEQSMKAYKNGYVVQRVSK